MSDLEQVGLPGSGLAHACVASEWPYSWNMSESNDVAVENPDRFSVYVIELKGDVCSRSNCPARSRGKPHVYVGETKKTPEERFAEHLAGGFTSSPKVEKHGIRLRPRLYRNWGPYATREDAKAAEKQLFDRLKRKGFCVYGGH